MKLKMPKINQAMTTCCWCEHKIGGDGPIYALGCKKRPEVDISKYEGNVMPVKITSSGKTIWAIVPPADSDAVTGGNDLVFTLAQKNAAINLKKHWTLKKSSATSSFQQSIFIDDGNNYNIFLQWMQGQWLNRLV